MIVPPTPHGNYNIYLKQIQCKEAGQTQILILHEHSNLYLPQLPHLSHCYLHTHKHSSQRPDLEFILRIMCFHPQILLISFQNCILSISIPLWMAQVQTIIMCHLHY